MTTDPLPFRCSTASLRRHDQRYATASPVLRWLLVEQPGPWGRDALRSSQMDRSVAAGLAVRSAGELTRVVLMRRPGRRGMATAGRRRWALVDSREGREATWWGEYGDDRELLEVPLDGSAGRRSDAPSYLVCTHGRHDVCCAVRGRPVAAALAGSRPDHVWECSHVGGDRFAANLVALPHGLYYGQVDPLTALDVAAEHEAGRVVTDHLRGRSSLPAPVQAAQHHARLELDERRIDAFATLGSEAVGPSTWRVRLGHADGLLTVEVAAGPAPERVLLTCSSVRSERPRVFRLVRLVRADRTDP